MASHDLQEPLRTIRSFIQLFKYSLTTELSKESESYLERVSIASDRMRGLIQDLLSYSRINIKEFSPARVDTRELVSVVLSDLTTRIHESKAVVLCEGALPVHGEYNILYRLFKNLIVNAIKFVSSDTSPVIKIKSFKNGNRVCFTIEDNGIGIPEEYRETVFEIFKRLHARNEYEGSGIGLSVCKKIIELHNGSISIDSNPDGGTSVSFDLPKTKQE